MPQRACSSRMIKGSVATSPADEKSLVEPQASFE
jgi:hypothetical protein